MSKPIEPINELDRWIYGAKAIGEVVDLPERKAFYALEKGLLDADKFGKRYRSTKRRLLKLGAAAASIGASPADQHEPAEV